MTNNEILHASLLDIIFDKRNKEYGAYALRSGYNKRMLISLGAGFSLILFFILFNSFKQKNEEIISRPAGDTIRTVVVDILPATPAKPELPKEQPKPTRPASPKVASAAFSTIKIVPNDEVLKPVAEQADLDNKQIDTKDVTGVKPTGKVIADEKPDGEAGKLADTGTLFVPGYTDPEYPGGQEALGRFLSQNLATPNDLESGEKKMVRVRFKVDTDGAVTGFEIEQTGGAVYDKEVIRVCKKMRRWKPALQNGTAVPVSYVLPVTFIGIEQ
jgi:periplasmic protein TonB